MRLALYCPVYGYYEKEEDRIGRNGDYYTSASVGNLFGELIAFQLAQWLAECQSGTRPVQIVEAGAHRGDLARDILNWLRHHRTPLFEALQYIILEPSARRREWQSATLADFRRRVSWLSQITDRASCFRGIIFANELLDAMPVRRFGWCAERKEWFEWGVAVKNDALAWTRLEQSRNWTPTPFEGNGGLLAVLPKGFVYENCADAEAWWQDAAFALERGKLMTIDYGLTQDELILPERIEGTLRGYYRHHPTRELLANPGDQDLTAHVNFSSLIAAGEAKGLRTETLETQAQFLGRIATQSLQTGAVADLIASRARQFQTLVHPDYLGNKFRVLVQARD